MVPEAWKSLGTATALAKMSAAFCSTLQHDFTALKCFTVYMCLVIYMHCDSSVWGMFVHIKAKSQTLRIINYFQTSV